MVPKELQNVLKWLWNGFSKCYDGGEENGLIQKGFCCCDNFLLSKYWLHLYIWRDSWSFSFSFFSFFFLFLSLFSILFISFSLCSVSLRTHGFRWYLRRKTAFKNSFQMAWDDMANPWLWRCGSCGYISGGCIFRSGVMHANIIRWG
jgi:hypothetical protein